MFKKIVDSYRNVKAELWKVIFPSGKQVKVAFFVVVAIVSFTMFFLLLMDLSLSSLLSVLM